MAILKIGFPNEFIVKSRYIGGQFAKVHPD